MPCVLSIRSMKSINCLLLLGAACLLLAPGCQSISTSHTNEAVGDRLAVSNPARVEILKEAPARSFARVGEVRAVCDTEELLPAIEKALRKEAAKLGADAVVIVKQGVHASGGGVTKRVVMGVAIKYL